MAILTNGYQTLVTFNQALTFFPSTVGGGFPGVSALEKEVQPPDADGGGEIDITTMRNALWRTKRPKTLITLGDLTIQAAYDPNFYAILLSIINWNNTIIITFPDASGIIFWGWVDKITPPSHKEGEFPIMEIKVHCSNNNLQGVEVGPIYVAPPAFGTVVTQR